MTAGSSVPLDPALPQLPSLLDPERMSGILGRWLEPGAPAPTVRIGYLRYRPAKSLLVVYKIEIGETVHDAFAVADASADLAARADAPESALLSAKLEGRTPTRRPLEYEPELDALVEWLPLDLDLPAMAEPPERLRDLIVAAGLEVEADDLPRIVKHKPTMRGVLRLNQHIVKTHPDPASLSASVRALDASASLPFPTARCTAVVPDLLIATQTLLSGRRPDSATDLAPDAGALLAVLHATTFEDLPLELPRDRLRMVAKQAGLLATVVPGLTSRLEQLMRELEAGVPADDELVVSHGDFHISQFLKSDGELGVVDFDRMCLAPAALDVASYAASLVERPDDVPRAAETLDVFVDAYGSRPPGVVWYLAARLLGRARRPFTQFSPGWPDDVDARVAAAEAALRL